MVLQGGTRMDFRNHRRRIRFASAFWTAVVCLTLGCTDADHASKIDAEPPAQGIPTSATQPNPEIGSPNPPMRVTATPRLAPPPLIEESPPKEVPEESPGSLIVTERELQMQFVRIPAGQFRQGTTKEQLERMLANDDWQVDEELFLDETPARLVTISKPFEMLATEVTQHQYRLVMGEMPAKRQGDNLPVSMVRYSDCVEYCRKLSAMTGWKVRLPTEAEWEYACRAGSDGLWSFGSDDDRLEQYAWYDWNALSGLMPVGKLQPNKWGLYDMHGNVWEWCSDYYSEHYSEGPVVDPTGPREGDARVVRGGYFFSPCWETRCAERDKGGSEIMPAEEFRKPNLGFRIVREIDE